MASVLDPSYAGLDGNHRGKTYDALLAFANDVSYSATAQTAVVFIGSGLVDCDLVIDVLEKTGTNAITVTPQYSATEDFSTIVADRVIALPAADIGRGIFPVRNAVENGLPGEWMRLLVTIPASNTVRMNAFLAKK